MFLFQLLEHIKVPRRDHQWLLADRIGAGAQGDANVRIVKVVGRTNTDVVNPPTSVTAALFQIAPEPRDLGLEVGVRKIAVEPPYAVVWIDGRDQGVARVANRLHMPRRNIARRADQSKIHDCTTSCGRKLRSK